MVEVKYHLMAAEVIVFLASTVGLVTSAVTTESSSSASSSVTPFELCMRRPAHFWSPHFRSCLPCTPCLSTLVPCGHSNDAECDDSDTAIRRIRDRVRNSSVRKGEFMNGLRKKKQKNKRNRERQRSKVGEVQATLFRQAEAEKERNRKAGVTDSDEVDGEVKYVATALPEDSLHEDLQEIERELYLDRMGLTLGVSTTTDSYYPSTMSTVPVLVLGKKKMFASSSKGKSSHRLAVASDDLNDLEDFPRDVYGAVVQNINNLESTTDDPGIDILHSLLLDSTSAEEAAAKSDSTASEGGGGGFSVEHGLIVAAFACIALVSVSAALGFLKWRQVQRFKVLDNNAAPALASRNLLSSHSSSFHRSTESRLTTMHSPPPHAATATVAVAAAAGSSAAVAAAVPKSPCGSDDSGGFGGGGTSHNDPRVLNEASPSTSRTSPSSKFVSVVDERGRTQLRSGGGGRELPV